MISPAASHAPAAVSIARELTASRLAAPAQSAPPAASPRAIAIPRAPLLAPYLFIEFDDSADRFVQTIVDPATENVLRRFPDEQQLEFSRGIAAYARALDDALGG